MLSLNFHCKENDGTTGAAHLIQTFFLQKVVGKTKIDRIRSQQIRESCGIQPINEWVERRRRRRRRKWDQHVTRMDPERLVKISRDSLLAGRSSPGRPKRRWSDMILD